MVWRMGQSPYTLGRYIVRHRLYIFGTFAWVATGALLIAGMQWTPHVQGAPEHAPVQVAQNHPSEPQVMGSETTVPSASEPQPMSTPSAPAPAMNANKIISAVTTTNSLHSPMTTLPSVSYASVAPDPTPSPTPDPLVCTADPTPYFSLIGNNTITIESGTQSSVETITSDATLAWTPITPIIWGDSTNTDPTAPVTFVVDYTPSTFVGSSLSYTVRALPSAAPGTYNVSWLVTNDAQSVCYNVNIVVMVVAPIPVAPVI